MLKLIILIIIVIIIATIDCCCINRSALNKIDVFVHEEFLYEGEKYDNVNFHTLDAFKSIDVIKANVFVLCEGMVKKFPRLQKLSLINVNLSRIEKDAFQEVPKLTHLSLSVNNLTSIKKGSFKNLPRLKVLFLSSNKIEDIEDGAFDDLNQLRKIYLDRNRINEIGNNWFLKNLQLHLIDLSFNSISKVQSGAFKIQLPNIIVEIHLQHNIIEIVDPKAVDAVEINVSTEDKPYLILHLEFNKINSVSAELVSSMDVTNSNLIFNSNNIQCIPDELLELLKFKELSLHIVENPLTCECVKKLKEFSEGPMMATLYFNTTKDFNECGFKFSLQHYRPHWLE